MAAEDSEETFRMSGMDSEEVAATWPAVKPLADVLGVRANIVASNGTTYHDDSLKAPNLAVAVSSSGVEVESDSQQKGHRQI
jgi:hypothetical protein